MFRENIGYHVDVDTIRVLSVDDQVLFAESLKYTIESKSGDIKVVGIASNGAEAVRLASLLKPDIALLDIRMPDITGVTAARIIHQNDPQIRIVMLTAFEDDDYVRQALINGAVGYILKNRPLLELIHAIRAVKDGIMQLDPSVARELLARSLEDEPLPCGESTARYGMLTEREKAILKLIVQAMDNTAIAEQLGIAKQTVQNYVCNIYAKLGTSNRLEIIKHFKNVK